MIKITINVLWEVLGRFMIAILCLHYLGTIYTNPSTIHIIMFDGALLVWAIVLPFMSDKGKEDKK